jgi:hyperosmotically inducible protein
MRRRLLTWVPLLILVAAIAMAGANQAGSSRGTERIIREVRHELVMLPYYGVFDNLAYRVDGTTVT